MELNDFLHTGTNSCKLKRVRYFFGGHGQKWVRKVWWGDSITGFLHTNADSQKVKADHGGHGQKWE